MSGIAGILAFDGEAPDPAVARTMLDTMPDRGADDLGLTLDGPAAIAHRVRWTTREARQERQPLCSRDGRILLVYDGRLDNRGERASALDLPPDSTDGAALVETIAREGADGLARCLGDFVVAWWEGAERRLGLAVDSLGMRPLYYAITPRGVVWASELQAVFRSRWIPRRVNEGFIAEYLALSRHSLDETPFDSVRRMPQAHALEIAAGRASLRRYWTPECRTERQIDEADAAAELRRLFTDAVQVRLRSAERPAFQLSGGVDSSSVVGVAAAAGVERPATFSMIYPGDPEADETEFVEAAERFTGARPHHFQPPPPANDPFGYVLRHDDLPFLATGEPLYAPLLAAAASAGHRVMLTGAGGDHWLTYSPFRIANLIRRGRIADVFRYARERRRYDPDDWSWRLLWSAGVVPLIPRAAKGPYRRLRPHRLAPSWVSPALARRVSLEDRLRASVARVPPLPDAVAHESLVRLLSGDDAAGRQELERMGTHAGLELRHPFYDRRVVEFLLVLPDDLRFRHGLTKYVLRVALGDRLPEAIRARAAKAGLNGVLVAITRRAAEQADWGRLRAGDLGWIDVDRVRALRRELDTSTDMAALVRPAFAVWSVLGLEAWLRRG